MIAEAGVIGGAGVVGVVEGGGWGCGGGGGGGGVGGGEALAPAGVARGPAQVAFGLGVGGAAGADGHHHHALARDQLREPQRDVAGRLGAEGFGQGGQPLAHRGWVVVDDVVQAGAVVLQRQDGGRGGVVQVDEGGDAAARPDDGELPFA